MSLFDLQDVCIVIRSLATLDIPMVVDLIGIYVLKGPYCTLTTTNWFFQALSVIPRGSWGDVSRLGLGLDHNINTPNRSLQALRCRPLLSISLTAAGDHVIGLVPISVTRRFPSVPNSSVLLLRADEGLVFLVVDLIRRIYRRLHLKSQIPCEFGWSQAPRRQQGTSAVIECRSNHQRCTIYLAERPAEGPAGKSARAEELLQREERLALGVHLGRGRIFMLEQTKNQLVKDKPAGQNLQEKIMIEDFSSEDDEGQLERRSADKFKLEHLLKSGCKREEKKRSLNACLDWSRREDIQARTVRGRLSWTGRRYLAGTVRGRPRRFGSLLPEVQGTSSWFISWMLEQHEDQAQSMKSSSSAESRLELKCRVEVQNAQVQNSSSADQVQCTRAVIECEDRYKRSDREQTKNQLVKDKPAGQNLQEQIMIEDFSSEDDEGHLENRSADKSKLEDFLKSGCKREIFEWRKEATNSNKASSMQISLMNKLESWLKTNQLDGRTDVIKSTSKKI
ncbi:hypothetical protein F511_23369 [Dorcoceras hygrometricum]|uniref:Uncharacterized protein n=1 Tax=Dorcoceras hygrometricum TaxID=472368 RepID=A0A2Z7BK26_9LAMI|nr:hypothetical protein F511_23369 [Dorcoceras hygrometricum]